jgi:hypothetical protein
VNSPVRICDKTSSASRWFLLRALIAGAVLFCALLTHGPGSSSLVPAAAAMPAPDQVSVTLHSQPGGITLGGDGSNVGQLDFGAVSAFGLIGSGLTRAVAANSFTITTSFGVKVALTSGSSQSFTLLCSIDSSSSGSTWQLNGNTLTSSQSTVAWNQPYNTLVAQTLAVTVPFTEPEGAFSRVIDLVAVPN